MLVPDSEAVGETAEVLPVKRGGGRGGRACAASQGQRGERETEVWRKGVRTHMAPTDGGKQRSVLTADVVCSS